MAFTVNDVEVIFTPEDRAYREAFGTLVCELDAMQEGLYRTQKKCRPGRRNAGRKSYEVFTSMDTEMRVKLDALLGGGIGNRQQTVILQVDHRELGRVVYQLNNEETQRVGVRLAGAKA